MSNQRPAPLTVQEAKGLHVSMLTTPIRALIREGEPCHNGEEIAVLVDRVIAGLSEKERAAALWLGVSRITNDVMRTERAYILKRLDRMEVTSQRFSGYDAPYLTLEDAQELMRLCESYVMVDKERRRAGSCSSVELRAAAEDYRAQAESALGRARTYERLAAEMDAKRAATLDELARMRKAA